MRKSRRPLPAWLLVAARLCLLGYGGLRLLACGSLQAPATGGFTSVTVDSSAGVGTATDTTTPADASDPCNASTGTDGSSSGSSGTAVPIAPVYTYGLGFSLQAVDHSGYCLTSQNNPPQANDLLTLAACQNTGSQQFYWYKGGFAVSKKYCITSPATEGGNLTLQLCNAGDAQTWQLSGADNLLAHTVTGTSWTNQALGLASNSLTSAAVSIDKSGSNVLRLAIAALPTTDGFRIHAAVSNSDYCVTDANGLLTAQACDANITQQQVWQLVSNQFQCASGNCLRANVTTNAVALAPCQSTPDAAQKWYVMDYYLSPMAPASTFSSSSLALDINTNTFTVSVAPYSSAPIAYSLGAAAFF